MLVSCLFISKLWKRKGSEWRNVVNFISFYILKIVGSSIKLLLKLYHINLVLCMIFFSYLLLCIFTAVLSFTKRTFLSWAQSQILCCWNSQCTGILALHKYCVQVGFWSVFLSCGSSKLIYKNYCMKWSREVWTKCFHQNVKLPFSWKISHCLWSFCVTDCCSELIQRFFFLIGI